MSNIERLLAPTLQELAVLTTLWENSVRASHDFLTETDIGFFRRIVREEALPAVDLYVLRNCQNDIVAFAGIAADKLEMLFVAPAERRRGLGRKLVEYTITHCGIRYVDVNEQNHEAAAFYARMGFRVISRDATDPSGKPHPILHLMH